MPAAYHYCANFAAGSQHASFKLYTQAMVGRLRTANRQLRTLNEGTTEFNEYRTHALNDAERSILIAVSHYRRTLDLLTPVSAGWALVTSYYGSFYAARALLHLFGCAVLAHHTVDVAAHASGDQRLRVRPIKNMGLTSKGSHQRFWELFYRGVAPIRPLVDPSVRYALSPPGGQPFRLISERNDVNYDSHSYLLLAREFASSFDKASFPGSLPGLLATQYSVLESLLSITIGFFDQFGLATGALDPYLGQGDLKSQVKVNVYGVKGPALVRRTRKSALVRSR